jgi:hypothetical protein
MTRSQSILNRLGKYRAVNRARLGLPCHRDFLSIYFGLCLIAFGALIYRRYCPPEIKRYETSTAFVGGDGPNIGSAGHSVMESKVFEVFPEAHQELARRLNERSVSWTSREDAEPHRNSFRVDIMHLYFDAMDASEPLPRAACWLLMSAGLGFLFVPAALVFYRVAGILMELAKIYMRGVL